MSSPTLQCPHCKKQHIYSTENAARPFCSEACKTADFLAWSNDEYAVAGNKDEFERQTDHNQLD